ncbi:MAG: hypothetical protein O3C68_04370, partial [Proteobacteria bacterium]|nr:hypothetical protein [Pseudomonadota bacterium]
MVIRLTRRILSSTFEGAILIVLIVVACYVSMGRILITNIDNFKSDFEATLSGALNVAVSVERLRGDWTYLDPEIIVDRMMIGEPGLPAIEVEYMSARLDTIASLREGTLVIRELDVDGLELAVRQDNDGHWFVEGLPESGRKFNADPLLSSLEHLRLIDVTGVDVEVKARKRYYHLTNAVDQPFRLIDEHGSKLLSLPLLFQEPGHTSSFFRLLGRYAGDPRQADKFTANLYLELPEIELADFLPESLRKLAPAEATLSGEFWLDWSRGDYQIHALPKVSTLSFKRGEKNIAVVKDLDASLIVTGTGLDQIEVYFDEIRGQIGSRPWALMGASISTATDGATREFGARVPRLDIANAVRVVIEVGGALEVISDDVIDALRSIQPGGELTELMLISRAPDLSDLQIVANIQHAHVEALGASPAISSIDGFMSLSRDSGYVDVHNKAFSLEFTNMFAEAWPFDEASARLRYTLSPGYLQVTSDLIELRNGPLTASGRVHLNLPSDKLSRS